MVGGREFPIGAHGSRAEVRDAIQCVMLRGTWVWGVWFGGVRVKGVREFCDAQLQHGGQGHYLTSRAETCVSVGVCACVCVCVSMQVPSRGRTRQRYVGDDEGLYFRGRKFANVV